MLSTLSSWGLDDQQQSKGYQQLDSQQQSLVNNHKHNRPDLQDIWTTRLANAHTVLPSQKYKHPPPFSHPFAGALDEQKQWGYVHDPTVLHKHSIASTIHLSAQEYAETCEPEMDTNNATDIVNAGAHKLLNAIQIAKPPSTQQQNQPQQQPKVFCVIYTYEGHAPHIQTIAQTWGSRCDGFMAGSTFTHRDTGTVHVPHLGTEGDYKSIWQKVRSLLAYVYTNFGQDYDYFHVCGDDTYLIVENLREFLSTAPYFRNSTRPMVAGGPVLGSWIRGPLRNLVYNGGGSGYTMNQAALDLFVKRGLAECSPNIDEPFEDLFMGQCLKTLGITYPPIETQDSENATRYHQRDPNCMLKPVKRGYANKQKRWREKTYHEPKDPFLAVSNHSISFHLIKTPAYMRRMDVLLYPQGNMGQYCQHHGQVDRQQAKGSSNANPQQYHGHLRILR